MAREVTERHRRELAAAGAAGASHAAGTFCLFCSAAAFVPCRCRNAAAAATAVSGTSVDNPGQCGAKKYKKDLFYIFCSSHPAPEVTATRGHPDMPRLLNVRYLLLNVSDQIPLL